MPLDGDTARWQIKDKIQEFTLLAALLLKYAGAAIAGKVITAIVLCLGGLSILWKYIEPMPKVLMTGVSNWTQDVRNGAVVYSGRKESLNEIAAIIKRNRHPILIRPSEQEKSHSQSLRQSNRARRLP